MGIMEIESIQKGANKYRGIIEAVRGRLKKLQFLGLGSIPAPLLESSTEDRSSIPRTAYSGYLMN